MMARKPCWNRKAYPAWPRNEAAREWRINLDLAVFVWFAHRTFDGCFGIRP
jgi:hypothetical protein